MKYPCLPNYLRKKTNNKSFFYGIEADYIILFMTSVYFWNFEKFRPFVTFWRGFKYVISRSCFLIYSILTFFTTKNYRFSFILSIVLYCLWLTSVYFLIQPSLLLYNLFGTIWTLGVFPRSYLYILGSEVVLWKEMNLDYLIILIVLLIVLSKIYPSQKD